MKNLCMMFGLMIERVDIATFLMRIDYNIHLDYSDVLIHPKDPTLSSGRDVDIKGITKLETVVKN